MNPDLWLQTIKLYIQTLQSAVEQTKNDPSIDNYKVVYTVAKQTESIYTKLFQEMLDTLHTSQQKALTHIQYLKQNETH